MQSAISGALFPTETEWQKMFGFFPSPCINQALLFTKLKKLSLQIVFSRKALIDRLIDYLLFGQFRLRNGRLSKFRGSGFVAVEWYVNCACGFRAECELPFSNE